MKQTAIEWYDAQLKEIDFKLQSELINFDQCKVLLSEAIEQAIQMEKEQIIEAYKADCETLGNDDTFNNEAEQYYNETFKNKKK